MCNLSDAIVEEAVEKKIAELERIYKELEQKDIELKQKDIEIEQKDIEIEQKDAIIKAKYDEIEQLKAKIAAALQKWNTATVLNGQRLRYPKDNGVFFCIFSYINTYCQLFFLYIFIYESEIITLLILSKGTINDNHNYKYCNQSVSPQKHFGIKYPFHTKRYFFVSLIELWFVLGRRKKLSNAKYVQLYSNVYKHT